MKNILIISFDMIPNTFSWGGSQRMYYLAEYLSKKNHKVTVLSCYKNKFNTYGKNITFNNVSLRIKGEILRGIIEEKRNDNGLENKKISGFNIKRLIKKSGILYSVAKKIDSFFYGDPSIFLGFFSSRWAKSVRKKVIGLIDNFAYENVVISGPPFGSFGLAKHIRNYNKDIRIILDYRDPWYHWKEKVNFAYFKEKKALKYADFITCTNDNLKSAIASTFKYDQSKIYTIANGFSDEDWKDIDLNQDLLSNSKVNFAFIGNIALTNESEIESFRDPRVLLQSFISFAKKHNNAHLYFIGVSNINDSYVKDFIAEHSKYITIIGFIDTKKALKYMINSDVLLLLHTAIDSSAKFIVSGKIYDYIKARKPIISIGQVESLHNKIISDLHLGIHVPNSPNEIYKALLSMYYCRERFINNIPQEILSHFSRDYQYSIIDNLLL